jgi:RNA polymerase sigma-70 factor (ECF subfamily)
MDSNDRASPPVDLPGFRACFVRHWPTVMRLSLHLVRDAAEAEDLAQEVFLSLSRQDVLAQGDAATRAWLIRVTLNRGLNALRSQRRRREREQHATIAAIDDDAESLLARRRDRDRVREVLAVLVPRAAKLLLLRQLGMSYGELAEIVDVAPCSIGTLLLRAQRSFAAIYHSRFGSDAAGESR